MVTKQKHIEVTLVRSVNKCLKKHKACVKGLGLRSIGSSATVIDTPENRGMVNKVDYLLKVREL